MADIELVIKISESRYKLLQTQARTNLGRKKLDEFAEAVLNGTPLPKGHGRLIDVNEIVYETECIYEPDGCCTTIEMPNIYETPTIIEADGVESENEDR